MPLHEGGKREDINGHVRSLVLNDKRMRRWRAEDKELIIRVLSETRSGDVSDLLYSIPNSCL